MSTVTVEQVALVRRLTLNRPDRRNALSAELLADLALALTDAADDRATSVVVLRGAGAGFSGGYDLAPPRQETGYLELADIWSDRERLRRQARVFEDVFYCPLPVIAQVHGFCLAGGTDLALHCDLMIAAEDCRIGYPPTRNLGVPPNGMWLYRAGPSLAKRLLLTGDSITGAEAQRLGVAIEAWPAGELDERTMALATRMAQVGREMLIGNKHMLNAGIDLMGRAQLAGIARTEDALGHTAPSAQAFRARAAEQGLRTAVRKRDAPFAPDPPGI